MKEQSSENLSTVQGTAKMMVLPLIVNNYENWSKQELIRFVELQKKEIDHLREDRTLLFYDHETLHLLWILTLHLLDYQISEGIAEAQKIKDHLIDMMSKRKMEIGPEVSEEYKIYLDEFLGIER